MRFFFRPDFVSPIQACFARVQSESNTGYDPSRLEVARVARVGRKQSGWTPPQRARELDSELTKAERTERTFANEAFR